MTDRAADNQNWLRARWQTLVTLLAADATASDAAWDALLRHYSEPHRAYHNLSHIAALLRMADEEHAHTTRPEVVGLGIWFHDVIYDTHAKDNEQRSAACARDALEAMHIDEGIIAPVEQCILATQQHEVPSVHADDLPLFLDLDLAILGAPESVYRRYSEAIRAEYRWIPDTEYRSGRADVLRRFLTRPALYFTPPMADRYEKAARHNIALELKELGQEL